MNELLKMIESSQDIYETAPCGFVFTLPDGTFLKANQTFCSWINQEKEAVVSQKKLQDFLAIGSRIYYETHYSPLLKMQGFLHEVTLDLKQKDGPNVPVLINSDEIKDNEGRVLFIRSTLFNITDRRSYEKELLLARQKSERSEKKFKFLSHVGDVLRRSIDLKVNIGDLTELILRQFCRGCSIEISFKEEIYCFGDLLPFPSSIIEEPLFWEDCQLINPADIAPALREFLVKIRPQSLIALPLTEKNEHLGIMLLYASELEKKFSQEDYELSQEIAKRICLTIETHLLLESNEKYSMALEESNEWLTTTLASIGDAVIALKSDKTVSFINEKASQILGLSFEEIMGKNLDDIFPIFRRENTQKTTHPLDQASKENNYRLVRSDQSEIFIEETVAPIKDQSGIIQGTVITFRDVTQKIKEAREKEETLIDLWEEKEVREKFVATLTHDLRSPITAAKISAQLIMRRMNDEAAVQDKAIRIINSINRADQMIQDLLDANRIRAGEKIPLDLKKLNLLTEIEETLLDLSTIHGDYFTISAPAPVVGYWDKLGIRRMLENLVNNAIKYGTPHSQITLSLTSASDQATISVHNIGNPISPKDQSTLFRPYRRTLSAHQSAQKGWGLGLTLVRGVAEAHGGSVQVSSSPDTGTTFSVTLPLDCRSSIK
jgi:PAS domain S-box-containing protein